MHAELCISEVRFVFIHYKYAFISHYIKKDNWFYCGGVSQAVKLWKITETTTLVQNEFFQNTPCIYTYISVQYITHTIAGRVAWLMSYQSSVPLWLGSYRERLRDCSSSNLGRVDVEILERIESDEDVTNISVHLELIIPLLEMADYCLLQTRKKIHSIKNNAPWPDQCTMR